MASPLILSLKKRKKCYPGSITVLSPAKINLYLNILGKYRNGFHRIESIVERISLCDEITIKIKQSPSMTIKSNNPTLQTKNNLIVKAAKLIKQKFNLPWGFDIVLNKKIPVGAGLGGGSSNAASTLIALNQLLNLRLSRESLYVLGAKLGSDVNFFLSQSKFAFIEGRGQKITPLMIDKTFHHYIIWPALEISTKKVYKNCRVKLTKFFNNVNIIKYALKGGDVSLTNKSIFNVLEQSAFLTCAGLKEVKDFFSLKKIPVALSGSGSAFYTLASQKGGMSFKKLKNLLPKDWLLFKVQTF